MNIAMVVYSHYSRDARVRRYAESLERRGYRIDVVCLKENYKPKATNISLLMYPLPRKRLGRLWYVTEYFFFFLYSIIILSINYFRKRYEIAHIHNMPDFLVFCAIVPKLFGAKIILDMHDPMPELYMSKFYTSKDGFMVTWLKQFEKKSFDFAHQIITANPVFKKMFVARNSQFADKISIILNCPDPRIFNHHPLSNNHHQFILLYMGTIEKRFGLDIVIEAIPNLIRKIPNLQFLIIPKLEEEGKYYNNFRFQISDFRLEKYVRILSPQPLENIAKYIKQADVGVVLAKNGIFTESIFPVKLLEFIQMNVPVIASKTKILSRYFNDQQIYFLPQNTPEEFTKAVIELYKNKNQRLAFTQKAKRYLQKNNWRREEKKYLELIMKEKLQIPRR